MLRSVRRAALGLAAAVAALTLAGTVSATPALADNAYHPSEADFADCPALPAGAVSGTWNCYVMTALDGTFQLNLMGAHLDQPLRVTVAQGRTLTGGTVATWGGITGDPLPLVVGIAGTPFETPDPKGWKVQLYGTGLVKPGAVLPYLFGVKARIIGAGLSDHCFIGNELEPVVVRPQLNWAIPAVFDGVGMLKVQADSLFAMPNALGCGDLAAELRVNAFVGLPAPATADRLIARWAVRHRSY
ncbi:hypothetical protein ACRYCC_08440 [Actinomadura scrupuli]|uniref:hypothetical protein n=1 Tax=Actinomadura scrupuli TaxID=559629 RepID=UPI003D957214